MTAETDFEIVRNSPLATDLTDTECRELAKIVKHRLLREGENLFTECSVDNTLYVIISGMLAVVKDTGGGDSITLHMYKMGDMVGELGFIDGTEHSATLRAMGETEVFALEREAFEGMLKDYPETVYKVMRNIMRTVHTILRRMNLHYVELTNYITKQHGKY